MHPNLADLGVEHPDEAHVDLDPLADLQSFLEIKKRDPVIITTFDYNKWCRSNDLTPMLTAA